MFVSLGMGVLQNLILTSSTVDKKLENFEFIFEFKIAINFEFNFEIFVNFEFIFEFFCQFRVFRQWQMKSLLLLHAVAICFLTLSAFAMEAISISAKWSLAPSQMSINTAMPCNNDYQLHQRLTIFPNRLITFYFKHFPCPHICFAILIFCFKVNLMPKKV